MSQDYISGSLCVQKIKMKLNIQKISKYGRRNLYRLWVCWIFTTAFSSGVNAAPVKTDPFVSIDALFRSTYADARQHILKDTGPIIIASGEDLTLLQSGKELKSASPPSGYRALTTVSHITLTVFLLLEPYGEGVVSPDRLKKFRQLSRFAQTAKNSITDRLADDLQLATNQKIIIDISQDFIQKILTEKKWIAIDLSSFLEKVKPLILNNVTHAAKFRIDHFHEQITAWKKQMPPKEWDRLHVIISGPVMPRKNNLAVQYFSKLFGVRGEGLKITYAESVFQQKKLLQIFGTNLLDTQIGRGYFADPWRMHRDLLGNAAAVYLDGVTLSFPEPGKLN